ncbi:hypothetical protein [Microbulbifer sp. HZ11]|uniref:hypothetical protein n=1 Tax=Microbulbifer sp. HZ11 TaxID=1453501 RepID=UPI0006924721|nr:hypothetical protein [Microbulbifer sp. HZ11]
MKGQEFVSKVYAELVENSVSQYREMYEKANPERASDEFGRKAICFYQGLSSDDKEVLLQMMRQVSVDTVSHIFAVLDGVSWLEGQESDFCLSQEHSRGTLINGDLQGMFLEQDEIRSNQ